MTVQEAKNQIEYNVKYRIFTPRVEALQIALECMEEVEQYRALGTVEGFQKALDSSLEYYNQMKEYKDKLQKYEALGTVEELKELKEMNKNCTIEQLTGFECSYNETGCSDCKGKQALLEAREKQIPQTPCIEGDGYADGHLVYDTWICPNCEADYEIDYHEYDYCPKCGQAINREIFY